MDKKLADKIHRLLSERIPDSPREYTEHLEKALKLLKEVYNDTLVFNLK